MEEAFQEWVTNGQGGVTVADFNYLSNVHTGFRAGYRAALAAREAEVGRLVKALKEFGDHDVRCDYRDTWLESQPKPCNCGLANALADHTP